jgi:hypothetical protein
MAENFDAGKAARVKIAEGGLVAELKRNTNQQHALAEVVDKSVATQIEHLDKHLDAMTRLRELQASDIDRQIEAARLTREEMALGRRALNENTAANNRLAAAIESMREELDDEEDGDDDESLQN